jgi:pimeloyl-ACP methyl ester carboxylesterase
MFHIASHAPNLLMQLLARMLESIADSKCQIGTAFALRRSLLDVHFAAFWERETNVHLINWISGEVSIFYTPVTPVAAGSPWRFSPRFNSGTSTKANAVTDPGQMKLKVDYCRASDGVRLAYAIAGRGPPLVKTANWMNHVEYDWESSILRHLFTALARDFTLIRYDARGNGLSDWDVEDVSLDAWVRDLETVVDAAGLDRFPLFAMSQGCAISVAFAVRHPERVTHLVLYGGCGAYRRAKNELELQKAKALATLIRTGWGEDSPVFRQLFSSLIIPGGTQEQLQNFAERQRKTTSAECAYRYFETTRSLDVSELLPKVAVPTLVMHKRDDQMQPFEAGRELAAGIPGARFVALPGCNHIPLERDPETDRMLEEIKLFLKKQFPFPDTVH